MSIIDFIRLLRKHLVLLLVTPVALASLVMFLTRKEDFKYASETTLYTGIATGSSVEMDKSFNYFMTNTAFDNLINVIKSRETQQELAIRLLAEHLMLAKSDPRFISQKSLDNLRSITPSYIYGLVSKSTGSKVVPDSLTDSSTTSDSQATFSFSSLGASSQDDRKLPNSIDRLAYEKTVKNLTDFVSSSDSNFVYKLINSEDLHYSIKAISTIKVQRIANSDLVQVHYETDDPGICQQTLAILTDVFIKNYKNIKENRSDAVVKYFEFQLKQANNRLKIAEDKLLEFNKVNNIINYYEQSKAVAVVKEDLDVEYNNKKIKLAGIQAAIKRLEEKLGIQQQIQLKSAKIIEKRNLLGELNYQINSSETIGAGSSSDKEKVDALKIQADKLKDEIRISVGELYSYNNSAEGLPVSTILNDWITSVIEAENIKAGIEVMGDRIREFQKQYSIYAPAGANIKKIEREISVSEQEFLEILHGLNLAKLKLQDNELSSNIKAVDPPYFPLTPIPTKRKILIIAGGLVGLLIVLVSVFVSEYFDTTLRNQQRAATILKLPYLALFPKILLEVQRTNFQFIVNRLLEIAVQNLEMTLKSNNSTKVLLFFSTLSKEGKSILVGNLARKLKEQGEKVLVLNYVEESLQKIKIPKNDHQKTGTTSTGEVTIQQSRKSIVSTLLGYPDTRINFDSPYLERSQNFLVRDEYLEYHVNGKFFNAKNYKDILHQNNFQCTFEPDYVLIELPPIVNNPFPVGLLSSIDLPVLVCRSNRVWSEADQVALDSFEKLTEQKTHFFINGVELPVVESILGDLPKERGWLRRHAKNFLRFQFSTKTHI